MNGEQLLEAREAAETIWAYLRPKDQRECLETYVTLRAFFVGVGTVLDITEPKPQYEDLLEE
jgi:hypothetical protein